MKDQTVQVSVIIPLYNKADTICDTVDSVLGQTHTDFELILVDDGSTDHWRSALGARLDHPKVTLIDQPHAGVSKARNTGIKSAQYAWVSFLDADDRWEPEFLERLITISIEQPSYKAFCSGRFYVDQGKKVRYNNRAIPKNESKAEVYYLKSLAWGNPAINSSNNLLARSLFEDARFDENMSSFEDHELWMRLFSQERLYMLNRGLSFYVRNLGKARKQGEEYLRSCQRYWQTIQNTIQQLPDKRSRFWVRMFLTKWALSESNQEVREALNSRFAKQYLLPVFVISLLRKLKFGNG